MLSLFTEHHCQIHSNNIKNTSVPVRADDIVKHAVYVERTWLKIACFLYYGKWTHRTLV